MSDDTIQKYINSGIIVKPTEAALSFMSAKTVDIHFNNHHLKYLKNLIGLIGDFTDLNDVIKKHPKHEFTKIYNNAAQIFNHNLFWLTLENIQHNHSLISEIMHNIPNFKEKFLSEALGLFGSGWIWVIKRHNQYIIETSKDADIPNGELMLVLDLWEHAYYLDHQDKRSAFVNSFLSEWR
jgi:Fe-Mn family superoxide dismutase